MQPRHGYIVDAFVYRRNERKRRTNSMGAAEHLTERYVEHAQAGLIRPAFVFALMCVFAIVGFVANAGVQAKALMRMPNRVHKRALLRCEQQEYAKVEEGRAACHVMILYSYASR